MATYSATLVVGQNALARTATAFSYNSTAKTLVANDDRVEFEEGGDYFAIKVLGDYSLVWDSDGVLLGDCQPVTPAQVPRLDFYCQTCGVSQCIASLTADGILSVPTVTESETLPEGLNLWDEMVFHRDGLTARAFNEVYFLAHDGDYVVTESGLLIRVRTAVEA